ncbi:MAG: HEAT repeat domain-containing protein, partial [Planctomycetota bacterium]
MTRRLSCVALLSAVMGAALAVCGSPAFADVAEIPLGRLAVGADVIIVGQVTRVIEVPVQPAEYVDLLAPTATLAEITVEQWIKGAPRPKAVWLFAEGTWICDVTDATLGERAVYLLEAGGLGDIVTPDSLARIKAAVPDATVHRVAWSGRGRMPIREIGGKRYATVWTSDVWLPAEMGSIPGPDPRDTGFKRGVLVEDLRRYIEARIAPLAPVAGDLSGGVVAQVRALGEPGESEAAREKRRDAASALESLGARAFPTLLKILADPLSPARSTVAEFLGGFERGQATLCEALHSEDLSMRRGAAFAVEWISRGGGTLEDALLAAAAESVTDADPVVRWRALWALRQEWDIEDERLIPALSSALVDPSPEVQWQAARIATLLSRDVRSTDTPEQSTVLAKLEPSLLALTKADAPRLRRAAWEALAWAGGLSGWSAARRAFSDPDEVVRINAIGALARMPATEPTGTLIALLRDKDAWIR